MDGDSRIPNGLEADLCCASDQHLVVVHNNYSRSWDVRGSTGLWLVQKCPSLVLNAHEK